MPPSFLWRETKSISRATFDVLYAVEFSGKIYRAVQGVETEIPDVQSAADGAEEKLRQIRREGVKRMMGKVRGNMKLKNTLRNVGSIFVNSNSI